jgi:hypothetical protein
MAFVGLIHLVVAERELTDMVLIYEEALSNADAARRVHMERFPRSQVPCARTFVNAVQHLLRYF